MSNSFDKIIAKIAKISPDIATCIDTSTHSIKRREILDKKTTCLINIASLTTLGSCHKALKRSINEAIDADCSCDEILETMLQISFSCGLSRSIDAIFEAKSVFEDRGLLKKKSKDKSEKDDEYETELKYQSENESDDEESKCDSDDGEDKDSSDEKDAQKLEIECESNKKNDNKVEKNTRNHH
ncbi:hypothetical protein C0W54_05460 [Photobacterium kishitanii]|uniref:carboxymuconolactone decarboxylase family protein n=1 Tax=Photobacterium kishitanii TaxID=318456 RepID=UPI000D1675F5|nr:carboxymuconolactone decarboxylase family protein [Photobacterium kishitanii]PSW62959.1 hypothetical protein C0W54_05460 [Photobacterium kishitanii]